MPKKKDYEAIARHLRKEKELREGVIRKARESWKGVDEVIVPHFTMSLAEGKRERWGILRGYVVEKEGRKTLILAPRLRLDLAGKRERKSLMPLPKSLEVKRAADFHTHPKGKWPSSRDMDDVASKRRVPMVIVRKDSVRIFVPGLDYKEVKARGRRPPGRLGKIIKPTILPDAEVLKLIKRSTRRKSRRR